MSKEKEDKTKNIKRLNTYAFLILVTGIIISIAVFINCSLIEIIKIENFYTYTMKVNFLGVMICIAIILASVTMYYVCKAIIDIGEK